MSDLRDLYQEMILDHGKSPRNLHALADANREAEGHNPLCGDRIKLYARLDKGTLEQLSFEGAGCAISQASASLLTEALRGKSEAQAAELTREFLGMLAGNSATAPDLERLDKLAVFSGVREFPMRVKCATLAWHTLQAALRGADEPITTEKEHTPPDGAATGEPHD